MAIAKLANTLVRDAALTLVYSIIGFGLPRLDVLGSGAATERAETAKTKKTPPRTGIMAMRRKGTRNNRGGVAGTYTRELPIVTADGAEPASDVKTSGADCGWIG